MPKYEEYLQLLKHISNDSDQIIQKKLDELEKDRKKLTNQLNKLEDNNQTLVSEIDNARESISKYKETIKDQNKSLNTLTKSNI